MENMIDHVILTISDFKRSVAFYAKALNRDVWWPTTAPLRPQRSHAFAPCEARSRHVHSARYGSFNRPVSVVHQTLVARYRGSIDRRAFGGSKDIRHLHRFHRLACCVVTTHGLGRRIHTDNGNCCTGCCALLRVKELCEVRERKSRHANRSLSP